MTKRFNYLDITKAIGIILVIIGHINYTGYNYQIKKYLYAFHMPLFFIIIGILEYYKKEKSSKENIKAKINDKINRIMIPYLLWALIYCAFSFKNLLYILYGSRNTLININSSLWFLPCYFLVTIFFMLYRKLFLNPNHFSKSNDTMKRNVSLLLAMVMILISINLPKIDFIVRGYPWSFNVALVGFSFAILGYYLTPLINKIRTYSAPKLIIMIIIGFLITLTFNQNSIEYVLMAENLYGNIYWFLFTALGGFFMVICLAIFIEKYMFKRVTKILCYIGKNTLLIFIFQAPLLNYCRKTLEGISSNFPTAIVILFNVFVILIIISILNLFLQKFIPVLVGQKTKK